jgi:recombination protein RecA
MSAALSELISRLGTRLTQAEALAPRPITLDWPELEEALPDGGLPRGVVELAAPRALGGAAIALSAIRAAHAHDARSWCAWIDPEGTLYAPGVAMAGIDLARMLVVRPPRRDLARVAVKVASARAFDVIVIDMDAVPGTASLPSRGVPRARSVRRAWPSEVLVRKLAILAEEGGAAVLLLTDARAPRAVPWPVALRLELARSPEGLALRVAKERRGRGGVVKTVPLKTRPGLLHDARVRREASERFAGEHAADDQRRVG